MGKTLDCLLGRSFKPSKFKALLNLAISRLAVLKNQRQARRAISKSDVVQLLKLGEHERALIRVERVIKECNMLDVFAMIEGYCILLSERIKVIEHERVCLDELKEAVSGLIFAASRCGEFPEMQKIRRVLTSHYGKEFTRHATELRNNCGVSPKLIQKLSTRTPSLESRMMVLKEIANENGIKLQLASEAAEDKQNTRNENQSEHEHHWSGSWDGPNLGEDLKIFPEDMDKIEEFADSVNRRKQYKDVAEAAQEAFLSAAYAAAAARAAVELSKSDPRQPDEPSDPDSPRKQVLNSNCVTRFRGDPSEEDSSEKNANRIHEFVRVNRANQYKPDSRNDGEGKAPETIHVDQFPQVQYNETEYEKKTETLNTFSIGDQGGGNIMSFHTVSRTAKVYSPTGSEKRCPPRLNIEKKLISVRTRTRR